jgi:hypothetical protein
VSSGCTPDERSSDSFGPVQDAKTVAVRARQCVRRQPREAGATSPFQPGIGIWTAVYNRDRRVSSAKENGLALGEFRGGRGVLRLLKSSAASVAPRKSWTTRPDRLSGPSTALPGPRPRRAADALPDHARRGLGRTSRRRPPSVRTWRADGSLVRGNDLASSAARALQNESPHVLGAGRISGRTRAAVASAGAGHPQSAQSTRGEGLR